MLEAFRHTVLRTIGPARKIGNPVDLRVRVRIRVINRLFVDGGQRLVSVQGQGGKWVRSLGFVISSSTLLYR